MTFKYYIWHDGQVKTSNDWTEILDYGGAYVLNTILSGRSFGYILPQGHQWISISPGDVPKAFKLGLMLLEVYI